MQLRDSFERDIFRPIDAVVKANSTEHLRNELEEFVVTTEVKGHLANFYEEYNSPDATGNGAWIAGFFGSGKSHLLKILAKVLEDRKVGDASALDLILPKLADDPMLAGAMSKARKEHPSESVLFNIDSIAPNKGKSDAGALLAAFIKAFNVHCGYFDGDAQHIAQLEYELDREGRLDAFKALVAEKCGKPWEDARKSALIYARQITEAFDEANGNPKGTTDNVVSYYKQSYEPSINSFAQRVREYIDARPRGFRLNFFVDEVGQFIAENVNLMVNLQSVAEELNTVCEGNSWVIVTSQENMEDIVGQMKAKSANDFSKIQARFKIKMMLTSSDAKEVIRDRLLAKKEACQPAMEVLYEANRADFDMLFDFQDGAKRYRCYQTADEFSSTYPFVPYQFELFTTSLRGLSEHNAFTGRHNSTGARSMLGVFQDVAQRMCSAGASVDGAQLATFDLMFEGLRNSLKSEVYAAINQAEDHLDNPMAVRVLKALIMVKYCQDFKATAGNVRVLMQDGFGSKTAKVESEVKEALEELERQLYIRRNGNVYEYLTNEEKEIENEIRSTTVSNGEVRALIEELVQDVCGQRKVTYKNGAFEHSFSYNLHIDGAPQGYQRNDLTLDIITSYEQDGIADVVPTAPKTLSVDLRNPRAFLGNVYTFLKTRRYVDLNAGSSDMRQAIIQDKRASSQALRTKLTADLRELLTEARYNAGGVDVTGSTSGNGKDAVASGMLELVRRSYPNLQQLAVRLTDNDVYNQCLEKQLTSLLPEYVESVSARLGLSAGAVALAGEAAGNLTSQFTKGDFGWPEIAVRSAVAILSSAGKVEVRKAGSPVEGVELATLLKAKRDLDKMTVAKVDAVSGDQLAAMKKAYRDLAGTNPAGAEAREIAKELASYSANESENLRAAQGAVAAYPFAADFAAKLSKLEACAANAKNDWRWAVDRFPLEAEGLAAAKKDLTDMAKFANGSPMQKKWLEIREFVENGAAELNDLGIEPTALDAAKEVVDDPECYKRGQIPIVSKEVQKLASEAESAKKALRDQVAAELREYRESFTDSYDFSLVGDEAQEEFVRIFEGAEAKLPLVREAYRIKDFVKRFKESSSARLIALVTPRQVQPDAPEDEDAPVSEPPVVRPVVHLSDVRARGYTKPAIDSEQDVDDYLNALRSELMRHISSGASVSR